MTGAHAVAIVAVVVVALVGIVAVALWVMDRAHARSWRAWVVAWDRVVAERRVSRDEVASAHQWIVEMAKSTQPLARAEEEKHLLALKNEASTLLNRAQLTLGLTVDHDAETQRTGGIVSGKGLLDG